MDSVEFRLIRSGGDEVILTNAGSKVFDVLTGPAPSTISFALPVTDSELLGIKEGSVIGVRVVDKATVTDIDPYFVLKGSPDLDFVTEDGVQFRSWAGESTHRLFSHDIVWPSAWPNPLPAGHEFRDATPATIIKTLLTRSQERGLLTEITHASFTGARDSHSAPWPRVLERTFDTGTPVLDVLTQLEDDGEIETRMVGTDLRIYIPGSLGITRLPQNFAFRAGQGLTEGSSETDDEEFFTDLLCIGDEGAMVSLTRPSLYPVLGRRKVGTATFSGITNTALLTVLGNAQFDQYSKIKKEQSYAVNHNTYRPFIDFNLHDWVTVDTGTGLDEPVQVRQISVTEESTGDISVAVTIGDLMDDAATKLKRRIDKITGANAGGNNGLPSPPGDYTFPSPPNGLQTSSESYGEGSQARALVTTTWGAPNSNTDGSALTDLAGYQVETKVGGTIVRNAPTTVAPARSDATPRVRFDRRSRTSSGWLGGDNAASCRCGGMDWFLWADTIWGKADGAGKVLNWRMPHNSITLNNPSTPSDLQGIFGATNRLTMEQVRNASAWSPSGATSADSTAWAGGFEGKSIELTSTNTNPYCYVTYTIPDGMIGKNFRAYCEYDKTLTAGVTRVYVYAYYVTASNTTISGTPVTGDGANGICSVQMGAVPATAAKIRVFMRATTSGAGVKVRFSRPMLQQVSNQMSNWRSPETNEEILTLICSEGITAGQPTDEYLWAADCWTAGDQVYGFFHGVANTNTGGDLAFDTTGNVYLAQWEGASAATRKLVRFEKFSSGSPIWGNACRVDGSYVYIMGYAKGGDWERLNYVQRRTATNPWVTGQTWVGTGSWASSGTPKSVVTTPMEITSIRRIGSGWTALYAPFLDNTLKFATATDLTDTWTTDQTLYTYPVPSSMEDSRYIPRFTPQYDTNTSGVSYLYCNNSDSLLNNILKYVPEFLRGPSGSLSSIAVTGSWGNRQDLAEDRTSAVWTGLKQDTPFQFRVRAYDDASTRHYSNWAESTPVLTASDLTGPPKPSQPLVTPLFRGVRVEWDGYDEYGLAMPEDYYCFQIHVSEEGPNFVPTAATLKTTLVTRGGSAPLLDGMQWGKTYYVRIVAYDSALNASQPSDYAEATTTQLADPDLPNKLITGAKIAENTINVKNITVASFDPNIVVNGNMEEVDDQGFPYAWESGWWEGAGIHTVSAESTAPLGGTRSMKTATSATESREYISRVFPITPGATYYVSATIKTSKPLTQPSVIVQARYAKTADKILMAGWDADASAAFVATSAGGVTTQTIEGSFSAPTDSGMTYGAVSLWAKLDASGAYDTWWDDIEVRKIVGEAAIANASIGTAKIKDLAVNNAKIADLSVGKLTSGVMVADVVVGGRFRTSDTFPRTEIDNAGMRTYDMFGQERLRTNDGNVWMSGTLQGSTIYGGSIDTPEPSTTAPGRVHADADGLWVQSTPTVNLCANPSLESLTGVVATTSSVSGSTAPTVRIASGAPVSDYIGNADLVAKYGTSCVHVTGGSNGMVRVAIGSLQPGKTYTVSWHAAAASTNPNSAVLGLKTVTAPFSLLTVRRTSDGASAGDVGSSGRIILQGAFAGKYDSPETGNGVMAYNEWQVRHFKTFTVPANWSANTPVALYLPAPSSTSDAVCYDGVQCEESTFPTRYADGDQPDCTWNGARDASTTTRQASFAMWVPTYGDPIVRGNLFAPQATVSRMKLGTGALRGTNFLERTNNAQVPFATTTWQTLGWPNAPVYGGIEYRRAQDDGIILGGSKFEKFYAGTNGVFMLSVTWSFVSHSTGTRGLRITANDETGSASEGSGTLARDQVLATTSSQVSATAVAVLKEGWSMEAAAWQSSGTVLASAGHFSGTCRAMFVQIA